MIRIAAATPRTRPTQRLLIQISLLVVILAQAGCTTLWDRVRESERMNALEMARTRSGRGQCREALASLDRAQARIDIGAYARESTVARARCYDKLGQQEIASAHRRLVRDFYTDEPMAYPQVNSVFRVKSVPVGVVARPPSWLKMKPPRYSDYAQRSKIVGRVIVSFELAGNDRPRKVRVLEMSHPLLATWAIEAVATAEPKRKEDSPDIAPGTQFITTFLFKYRWAGQEEDWEGDS